MTSNGQALEAAGGNISQWKALSADFAETASGEVGIGDSSWVLAQRPSMGVMSNPYAAPRRGIGLGFATLLALVLAGCSGEDAAPLATNDSAGTPNVMQEGGLGTPDVGREDVALAQQTELAEGAPSRIVLIVVDTLRRDHLGVYGGAVATPRIDSLAENGRVFAQATASFHHTTFSMAALFTGRTPSTETGDAARTHNPLGRFSSLCGMARFAGGFLDSCLPEALDTLAERLRDGGYETLGVTSNLLLFQPRGYDQGFEVWAQAGPDPKSLKGLDAEARARTRSQSAGDVVNAHVREVLEARRSDQFFLYVHYMDVHDWWLVRPRRLYDESVALEDAYVGELVDHLGELGLAEDTLFVLTSDHGESLGEAHAASVPKTNGHDGNPSYETVLGIPLIMAPREFVPPDTNEFIRSQDIGDLILSASGLSHDRPQELAPDEYYASEARYQIYRRGRYKSARSRVDDVFTLFDLEADPLETEDVSSAHPEVVAAHRARMHQLALELASQAERETTEESAREARRAEDNELRLRALGYIR